MRKPKDVKGSKGGKSKSKGKEKAPETADDVLATGVEYEEAGEKWRSGDTAKSSRFFARALDAYEGGLHSFPTSFDLAYNRARLFYELIEQPAHMEHVISSGIISLFLGGNIPRALTEQLHSAIYFTQYALNLEPDNAEAIFNLAQIHTSLAEAAADNPLTATPGDDAFYHLQLAVDLFDKCFGIQHARYLAFKEFSEGQINQDAPEPIPEETKATNDTSTSSEDTQSQPDERWASIESPVTEGTLVETCIAEVHALTTMLDFVRGNQSALQDIEAKTTTIIQKAEGYLIEAKDDPSNLDFNREKANAAVRLLIASFRFHFTTAEECSQHLDESFEFSGRDSDAESLSKSAEARVEFNSACMTKMDTADISSAELQDRLHLQWRQLSTALDHLSRAAKLPGVREAWLLQARKADVELYRSRLAERPYAYEPAVSNLDTLLKNADVFYRGAKNLASAAGEQDFVRDMAQREQIVQGMRGQGEITSQLFGAVREMVDEGLLSSDVAARIAEAYPSAG